MRLLLFTISLTLVLSGCVSTAELVQAVYKPKKGGVVRVPTAHQDWAVKQGRQDATKIMNKFCSPDRPELISINKESEVTGTTGSKWAGVTFTQNSYSTASFVQFVCSPESHADIEF